MQKLTLTLTLMIMQKPSHNSEPTVITETKINAKPNFNITSNSIKVGNINSFAASSVAKYDLF